MEYHAEDLARHVRLLHALVVADHASCASHRELRAAASDSDTFDFSFLSRTERLFSPFQKLRGIVCFDLCA